MLESGEICHPHAYTIMYYGAKSQTIMSHFFTFFLDYSEKPMIYAKRAEIMHCVILRKIISKNPTPAFDRKV